MRKCMHPQKMYSLHQPRYSLKALAAGVLGMLALVAAATE